MNTPVNTIFQDILNDIGSYSFVNYEHRTIRGSVEVNADNLVFFVYYGINDFHRSINVDLIFDIWDNYGDHIKTRKLNYQSEVEALLVKYFKELQKLKEYENF